MPARVPQGCVCLENLGSGLFESPLRQRRSSFMVGWQGCRGARVILTRRPRRQRWQRCHCHPGRGRWRAWWRQWDWRQHGRTAVKVTRSIGAPFLQIVASQKLKERDIWTSEVVAFGCKAGYRSRKQGPRGFAQMQGLRTHPDKNIRVRATVSID